MAGRRAGLFLKYFAFIVLLVSGGLVASGAIGLYFSYQETRNSVVGLQREKALTAAVRIERFLRDIAGIAQGFATIGTIGFEGRQDYGVIGAANNLAARLCAQAAGGQVLVSQRVHGRVEGRVVAEPVDALALKGFHEPVPAFRILAMKAAEEVAP